MSQQIVPASTGTRPTSSITVGKRFRKDLGDLDRLVQSIADIGLVHPIVITSENKLIAGVRRLEAPPVP